MLPIVLAVFFVLGGVQSSPAANGYIDAILNGPLQNELRMLKLDPAALANFQTQFEDKVTFIGKVKGNANYTNGNITGLLNVMRFYECNGPSYSFGRSSINCTIAFHNLKTNYNSLVKYGKLPKVNVKAKANITTTVIFVDFVSGPNPSIAQLRNLQFHQFGEVKPKFTGLGKAFNKFLKVMEDGYKTHVRAELTNVMFQRFQYALNRAASQIIMPR